MKPPTDRLGDRYRRRVPGDFQSRTMSVGRGDRPKTSPPFKTSSSNRTVSVNSQRLDGLCTSGCILGHWPIVCVRHCDRILFAGVLVENPGYSAQIGEECGRV
ncbi:hypothetical protein Y032_0042g568 [Ancylostoma ceylanicum]|uniref:Uncharacterized protein n=1 Tax=Ancylostoma ceylanicum TaxID=53326 RepID=A0A016UFA4_9BILA|nr:hypothetical protein Y032_0042g568 [Ancylostoma ceylanicum]